MSEQKEDRGSRIADGKAQNLVAFLARQKIYLRAVGAVVGLFAIAIGVGGCATRPKTYAAPDATKVNASEKRLAVAVDKATATAARAQAHVEAAQKSSDQLAGDSVSVINQVAELARLVPPELRGKAGDLQTAVEKQQVEEGELSTHLAVALMEQGQLRGELAEATAAKLQFRKDQTDYQNAAAKIAEWATEENAARVKVEKKLSWYRWHWWGSWIALGAGVLACGLFAFLKFTGRLSLKAAAVAARAAI